MSAASVGSYWTMIGLILRPLMPPSSLISLTKSVDGLRPARCTRCRRRSRPCRPAVEADDREHDVDASWPSRRGACSPCRPAGPAWARRRPGVRCCRRQPDRTAGDSAVGRWSGGADEPPRPPTGGRLRGRATADATSRHHRHDHGDRRTCMARGRRGPVRQCRPHRSARQLRPIRTLATPRLARGASSCSGCVLALGRSLGLRADRRVSDPTPAGPRRWRRGRRPARRVARGPRRACPAATTRPVSMTTTVEHSSKTSGTSCSTSTMVVSGHLVEPAQQRDEGLGLALGDAGGRLVEQQQARVRPARSRPGRPPGGCRSTAARCGGGGSARARSDAMTSSTACRLAALAPAGPGQSAAWSRARRPACRASSLSSSVSSTVSSG